MTDSSEKTPEDSVTELISIDRVHENNTNKTNTSAPSNNLEQDTNIGKNKDILLVNRTFSWHEHVYKKLTNKPTPHYIENILGLQNKSCDNIQETVSNRMTVCMEPKPVNTLQDSNEPLNLSVRSDCKVRLKPTAKG